VNEYEFKHEIEKVTSLFPKLSPMVIDMCWSKYQTVAIEVWVKAIVNVCENRSYTPVFAHFVSAVRVAMGEKKVSSGPTCDDCNGVRFHPVRAISMVKPNVIGELVRPCEACNYNESQLWQHPGWFPITRERYEEILREYLPENTHGLSEGSQWEIAERRFQNPKFDEQVVEWLQTTFPDHPEFAACVDAPMALRMATTLWKESPRDTLKKVVNAS